MMVSLHVNGFVERGGSPSRISSRFLFDLEPSVDVIREESLLALIGREVMDFMYLDQSVAHFHSFLDFGGTPFSAQHALLGCVSAEARFFQEGFGHLFFHARLT